MSITISLPWPDKRLSPNARVHWSVRHRVGAAYADLAHWTALEAGARSLAGATTIKASITFTPPDARRRDDDNAIAAFKSARDGIASATRVDDSRWLASYAFAPPAKPGRVTVTLEAVE